MQQQHDSVIGVVFPWWHVVKDFVMSFACVTRHQGILLLYVACISLVATITLLAEGSQQNLKICLPWTVNSSSILGSMKVHKLVAFAYVPSSDCCHSLSGVLSRILANFSRSILICYVDVIASRIFIFLYN